jgi:hypothetical protein
MGLSYRSARARIFKRLWSPGIDFKESIPHVYVARAGPYDNPIPTRFLAPVKCLKILAPTVPRGYKG